MITHQRTEYNWKFVYLGANQDSFQVAGKFGINKDTTSNFDSTKKGLSRGFGTMSYYTAEVRNDASNNNDQN